jgi:hypothetical protein
MKVDKDSLVSIILSILVLGALMLPSGNVIDEFMTLADIANVIYR